jgi:cathepsin A (carboxypeptidase C)
MCPINPVVSSCFKGNERWLAELDTEFLEEFKETKPVPWFTSGSGRIAGEVRSAGGNGFRAGNVTFVDIHEAG